MKTNGLAIRCFDNRYCLCDGKAPQGAENSVNEIWIGTAIQWFNTWEEADAMRKIIDAAYGR